MLHVTVAQKLELERFVHTGQPHYVRPKALALCHLAEGKKVAHLAAFFRVSRQTIYQWQAAYLAGGLAALSVQPGRGPKASVTAEDLATTLHQPPRQFGVNQTRWTLRALADTVPGFHGQALSTVHYALRRARFSHKRGQLAMHSPDPDYVKKKTT